MAGSPQFKVYRDKEYVAACKHLEDAAAIVAMGSSGQIRFQHTRLVLWDEGRESQPAAESYDFVVQTGMRRLSIFHGEAYAKQYGPVT